MFHRKGVLIKQTDKEVFYKYFPDYFEDEKLFGEYSLNFETWQTEIILRIGATDHGFNSTDEHCVAALTYKIRKSFEENQVFPEIVFHIA